MTEPTDNLQQRCAEVMEWQRTGVLTGNALRNYAAAHWEGRHDSLQMAERDTSAQAMQWIAKWGTPPVVAGEPVAWYEYNADLDAWFLAYSHNPKAKTRPLVFGDTTPQPTQAQAGAVPLTRAQVVRLIDEGGWTEPESYGFRAGVEAAEKHHGIKGGQHGL